MTELIIETDNDTFKYNVPESWEEITVDKYIQLIGVVETDNKYEYLKTILFILTGIPEDIFYQIPGTNFSILLDQIRFLEEDVNGDYKDSIQLNGTEYFIKKDFDQMNTGEIISIETITNNLKNPEFVIDKMLCIFLRKKLENGKLERFRNDMMERAEEFKQIMITDVHSLFVFFSNGGE